MTTWHVSLADPAATVAFGHALASILRAGDLVVLSGDLGAGKTTLAQGIGTGLGVRGQVASPTFIIARVHPSLVDGPALVHVDAYRLGSLDEVEALDLDTSLEDSVTVVEWGEGLVEELSEDRLEIHIARPRGTRTEADAEAGTGGRDDAGTAMEDVDGSSGVRTLTIRALGERWLGVELPVVG